MPHLRQQKPMKVIIALILSSVFLTACGSDNDSSSDNHPANQKKPVMDCAPK